jgi:hypothetical protein
MEDSTRDNHWQNCCVQVNVRPSFKLSYSHATTPKRAAAPAPIAGNILSAPLLPVALALAELAALVAELSALLAALLAEAATEERLDEMLDRAPDEVTVAASLERLE